MFTVNDKVVYPGHGVASIARIIEREVGGCKTQLFELSFLNRDMTILVPKDKFDSIGIRPLCTSKRINDIFNMFARPAKKINYSELVATNWNKRSKEYVARIRTGDIEEISKIYRDLHCISQYKELSFGEKNLLSQTETLLAEEISLVRKENEEQAVEELRAFFRGAPFTRGAHKIA